MTNERRERVRILLIGLAAVLAAALLWAVLYRFVGARTPFLTFFPAVILASLWGGTGAGTSVPVPRERRFGSTVGGESANS